jgi:hypothetical protein
MWIVDIPKRTDADPEPCAVRFPTEADAIAYQHRLHAAGQTTTLAQAPADNDEHVTLIVKIGSRTRTTYPVNRYAAERQARALLGGGKAGRITKRLEPGRILLRCNAIHEEAIILVEPMPLNNE